MICLSLKPGPPVVHRSPLKALTPDRTVKLGNLTKLTLILKNIRNSRSKWDVILFVIKKKAPSKNTFNFLETVRVKNSLKNKLGRYPELVRFFIAIFCTRSNL